MGSRIQGLGSRVRMFWVRTPKYMHCGVFYGAQHNNNASKVKGADLYVVRLNRDSSDQSIMAESKPCCGCARILLQCHVKRVFYSTNNNTVEVIKVKDLITQAKFKPTFRQINTQLTRKRAKSQVPSKGAHT